MTDKLLPCPFCGGEAEVFDYWNDGKKKSRWVVMCKNCKGGLGELDTKEEAFEKWNNRWMIPCEEGETKGNWHTGTPTEEGDYLVKLDVEHHVYPYYVLKWANGWYSHYDMDNPACLQHRVLKWQKIEPYRG